MEGNCLGCSLANNNDNVHVVYENEYVSCFLDHDPYNEGHVLILPKKHIVDTDALDFKTANAIMRASMLLSKAVKSIYNPDGITICQNGGIFNELGHYHMHVVPRYKGQSFANFYSDEPLHNECEKNKLYETKIGIKEKVNELMSACT